MARTGLRALFGLAAVAAAAAMVVLPILGPCGATEADIVGRFTVEIFAEYPGPYRVLAQNRGGRGEEKQVAAGAADLRIVLAPIE